MKEQIDFELRGRVIDDRSGKSVGGLRVVAVDQARGAATVLLVAETEDDGRFAFKVDRDAASALLQLSADQDLWRASKLLYLSVFNGSVLLGTFETCIGLEHLSRGELKEELRVRLEDTARLARLTFEVSGRVVDADGAPQVGITIQAHHVEIGSINTLGISSTDASGSYAIEYEGHDRSRPDDPAIDLQIVASQRGEEVARSPVVFSPDPRHRIDLVLGGSYRGRSELERVQIAITPHMGEVSLAELGPESIEILAQRADVYPPHLAMQIQAARLAGTHEIDASIFYALMRGGLPADLPGMLSHSRSSRRAALERAYAERILPAPSSGTVDEAIDAALEVVDGLVVDAALAVPGPGETNLRALLDTSGLSESLLRRFFELQVPFEGSNKALWEAVHADANLSGAPAEVLEFTMEAATLVRSFLPALQGLQTLRGAQTISEVADLAAWDVPEWLTFIGSNGGAPEDLPGETAGEREQLYAETLTRIIEDRYPTQVLARRIQRDTPASTAGVAAFLDQNPDFHIARTVIPIYLDENPGSVPGNPEETAANLKTVQRVWSLTPRFSRYDVTRVLLDQGVTSAAQVVRTDRQAFVATFAAVLEGVHPVLDGEAIANALYRTAVLKHTSAQVVLAKYATAFNQVSVGPIQPPALPAEGAGVPTLAELMGSLDFCACEHCRSMLSPAAYLVELLSRLGDAAGDVLSTRREDLRHIELSCINTNTPLPYIDIVNELLEHLATTQDGDPAGMPAHQTTWTAAELRRFPEYRNVGAYAECATAVYPWSLPMHVPSVELGLYLERLGVGRHEMMVALQKPDGTDPEPSVIVAEALGMTTFERDVVVGTAAVNATDAWNGANAAALGANLRQLLDIVDLELDGLLRLLGLRFIVPSSAQPASWLIYENQEPSCDLDDISLNPAFDEDVADRLHRFVRVARKTGLSWAELDTALRLMGEQRQPAENDGVLDEAFLAELVDLLWLRARLGLDLVTVVALSSRIETHDYEGAPALHRQLFLSKADLDGAFELTGDVLTNSPPLAEVHHATIRAGIRVNDSDLKRLIDHLWGQTPPNLSIETLSALYAHAVLARALRLRIDELLRLLALVDVDPFASPAETVAFVKVADEIAASRMSVEQLDYLCRHRHDEVSGLHPTEDEISAVLQGITDRVAALDAELAAVSLENPELPQQLVAHLEAVFIDQQAVIDWMRILSEEPTDQDDELDGADRVLLESHIAEIGMEPGDPSFIEQIDVDFNEFELRFAHAIEAFSAFRREKAVNSLVEEALAAATGLAPEAAGILARTQSLITVEVGQQPPLPLTVQAVLVGAIGEGDPPPPAPTPTEKREALLRVHKAALIILGLQIPPRDISWYFSFESDNLTPQALDLNELPLESQNIGVEHLARWRQLARAQALQDVFRSVDDPLPEIGAQDQSRADIVDRFVEYTRWERDDVEFLLEETFLDLADPVNPPLRDPRLIARMRDVIELVRRTGVRVRAMAEWARAADPTADMAAAARRALKARHTASAWADVVVPLTDALRERQRDALVALIVQNKGWFPDEIALFNSLLVDPQMNACMLTSRIRLALSSVQLFIQRLLLGMESASIPEGLAEDWSWLRTYRVWEANRKVFFWPENWAEPELRDDKTPFFRELEEQLDQGPLDERNVERAFADYLYKLHEVAHLDIVAIHEETSTSGDPEVVHVVGRTRTLPRKHYYRQRVNDRYWTAWEHLPVDIDGDQIDVFTFGRRLFVVWLEVSEERTETEDGKSSPPEFRFQISWVERRDGSWGSRRVTAPSSRTVSYPGFARDHVYLAADSSLVSVVWFVDPPSLYAKSGTPLQRVLAQYDYEHCLDWMQEDDNPLFAGFSWPQRCKTSGRSAASSRGGENGLRDA